MSEESKYFRKIRSFVLRAGRLTPGQQKALDDFWPIKGLDVDSGIIDPKQVFGRNAPLVLEIGFGMGASFVQMAQDAPEKDFIGIEVHRPGVGRTLGLSTELGLNNIRIYCDDAIEVLAQCISDESVDTVQLYFPDPWHKKKHHKRRILQPDFIQQIRKKLKVGGVFHMATDWENYAEHMMEHMSAADGFINQSGQGLFAERPDFRPRTKFENRGERLGHGVWDLLFEKTS